VNLGRARARQEAMLRRSWLARINALVLALMVCGGGSGLPVFDALFHHIGGSRALGYACVERADVQPVHSERCSLGAALPALGGTARVPNADGIGLAPFAESPRRYLPSRHAGPPAAGSLPRAPPVSVA
jgi:hypothetical protein